MCTGKCSRCIGVTLFPLASCAIVSNILLYFPNGQVLQLSEITDLVWFFQGILGAGILMLLSVLLALLGFAGAVYCAVFSSMGLIGGPLCDTGDGEYLYPFRNSTLEYNYLFNQTTWSICKEPENIILWNIVLFSILVAIGVIEAILCLIQVINGLIGFVCGTCGFFFVNPMRSKNYVTVMDPLQEAYGNMMGSLLFIPLLLGEVFWFAAILASLDWNQTSYGLPSPLERGESAMILPFVLHYLCPAYISIAGLGAIAAAATSSADSALLSAGSMFAHNIYRKILRKKATEREVLWAMRTSMLVFGAGAAGLAFYSSSVYDLWFLSGELVYALLFPQLCCALFTPSSNTYGSAAGFLVGLLLRLLAGEPALKIPPIICYPVCSLLNGSYVQLFPYKTFTMLFTLGTIIAVSYLATVLFQRNLLPRRWDVCNVLGETSTHTPLRQIDKQTGLQTVPLEENHD
ncbi:UNVERIFIED_CONTAM: hypothetical protein H355_006168 [Colinus virginianus]|nr:hypothetical protein H355_006168 [Colinus virginianus]